MEHRLGEDPQRHESIAPIEVKSHHVSESLDDDEELRNTLVEIDPVEVKSYHVFESLDDDEENFRALEELRNTLVEIDPVEDHENFVPIVVSSHRVPEGDGYRGPVPSSIPVPEAWLSDKNCFLRPKRTQIPKSGKIKQIRKHSEVHGHFKVPHQLRQVNQAAYEPQLISIGPCHRDKEHLRDMEMIKMQCFSRLLNEKGEETMNRCLEAISNMEEKARNWYEAMSNIEVKVRAWWHADMWRVEEKVRNWWFGALSKMKENVPILEEVKAFLLMILVDGCFIIQLLCMEPQDQFAKLRWSRLTLLGDLLLLENQLPFFVLVKLYSLIKDPTDGSDFGPQAFAKFIEMLPGPTADPSTIKDTNEINHLLGLVHDNWIPSTEGIERHWDYIATGKGLKGPVERQSIRCARELEEAGIVFIKVEKRNAESLFDVNFKDGKMKIPEFVIGDNTERLFRNLIAYELFVEGSTYVIDYVTLMDNLVNTANDVQLLRSCGVIENMLGDDKAVAQMLNKLRDSVTLCGDTFFYEETIVNVQKHCKRRWNTWKARLRHDYFSNPWARIAFVAGLLVFLTTIATFILSFFMKN